jgi:hypothetical protein
VIRWFPEPSHSKNPPALTRQAGFSFSIHQKINRVAFIRRVAKLR